MITHRRIEILISSHKKNLDIAIYNASRYSCLLEETGIRSNIYISCPHECTHTSLVLAFACLLSSRSEIKILYLQDSGIVTSLLESVRWLTAKALLLVIDDCLPQSINAMSLNRAIAKIDEENYDYVRLNRRGVCISSRTHNPKWLPYYLSFTTAYFSKDFLLWLLEKPLTLWMIERCFLDIPKKFKVLPASLEHLVNPPINEVHCLRGGCILTLNNEYSTLCRSLGYELMPFPRRLYDHCYNQLTPIILTFIAYLVRFFEKLNFIER
jgi:hypothetical protein